MIHIHYGAGVRTVTVNGVTYDLNAMDRQQYMLVRKHVVNAWQRARKQKKGKR